jgi:general secretion pathway protein H
MDKCTLRRDSDSGFTLLELLIVLALIAIASVFSIAAVDRLAGRVQERRWSDLTQQSLAKLRNKAVMGGTVVRAEVDFEDGQLVQGGSDAQDRLLVLPASFRFLPTTAVASGDASPSKLALYFYPDGTMDEATFDLVLPSEGRRRFHLARFTGKIERTTVQDVLQ